MSDLTSMFTRYFRTVRKKYPDVDAVVAGGDAGFRCAYFAEKGLTFTNSTDPDAGYAFELALMRNSVPSESMQALELAACKMKTHIVFNVDSDDHLKLDDCDNKPQHSVVFREGPPGWIQDLYKVIAKGMLVKTIADPFESGILRTETTYDHILRCAISGVYEENRSWHRGSTETCECCGDEKKIVEAGKLDSKWLIDYRGMSETDITLVNGHRDYDCPYNCCGCGKRKIIMHRDKIVYIFGDVQPIEESLSLLHCDQLRVHSR